MDSSIFNSTRVVAKYGAIDDGRWPMCLGCLHESDDLVSHMGSRGCLVDGDKFPQIAKDIERFYEILEFQLLEHRTLEQEELLYSLVVPEGLPYYINNVLVPAGANYMEAMKNIEAGHY